MSEEKVKLRVQTKRGGYYIGFDIARGHKTNISGDSSGSETIDLTPLSKHPALTKFDLDVAIRNLNLKPIAECPNLHSILLASPHVDLEDLIRTTSIENIALREVRKLRLAGLSSLRRLYIGGDHGFNVLWGQGMFTPPKGGLGNIGYREQRYYNVHNPRVLSNLDLKPLSKCPSLEHLVIVGTDIEELDLKPLRKCQNLEVLCLEGNRFTQLDLTPLSDCTNLTTLYLDQNYLSSIDLSPLESCHYLRKINLKQWIPKRSFDALDLTPLRKLPLEMLNLGYINEESLDLTPLSSCKNLKHLEFYAPMRSSSLDPLSGCTNIETLRIETNSMLDITPVLTSSNLPFQHSAFKGYPLVADYAYRYLQIDSLETPEMVLKNTRDSYHYLRHSRYSESAQSKSVDSIVEQLLNILDKQQSHRFRVQLGILEGLEMSELSGFDDDLSPILSFAPKSSYHEFREHVYRKLVDELEQQFQNGGPTLFFDVDVLRVTPATVLIPSLLKRRKDELNQTEISIVNDSVSLLPIWLTGDGFRILRQLGVGEVLKVPDDSVGKALLDTIVESIKKTGAAIRVVDNQSLKPESVSVSDDFRSYVLLLAKESSLESQMLQSGKGFSTKEGLIAFFTEKGYHETFVESVLDEVMSQDEYLYEQLTNDDDD